MDKAEAARVAVEIAGVLGETGERPRAQIARIVGLMGAEWTRDRMGEADAWFATGGCRRRDGEARTRGGAFFEVCRRAASGNIAPGGIKRRAFFRCFFDFPPQPRQPKPEAPKKAKAPRVIEGPLCIVEAPPDPYHVQHRTKGGKGPVGRLHDRRAPQPAVEVYTVRRRA